MRVAVVGATGRIGRLTVGALARGGRETVGIGVDMAGDVRLRIAPTTFDDRLAGEKRSSR